MKSFNEWLNSPAPEKKYKWSETGVMAVSYLLDYNDSDCRENELVYPCRVCGELVFIECMCVEFDPDRHYCGSSPACCP